jgi:hypothetical protein
MFHRKSWVLKVNDTFISDRKQHRMRRQKMKEEIGADLTQEWLENPFARYFGTDIQR